MALLAGGAYAEISDPPGRVGRVGTIEGDVLQATRDAPDWTPAVPNYPVSSGLALATGPASRAEIEIGAIALRIGDESELDVTQLDESRVALSLTRGALNLRIGGLHPDETVEISTPRGFVNLTAPGSYRIDAGSAEAATRIAVFGGRAVILRDEAPIELRTGRAALLSTEGEPEIGLAARDTLDEWAAARDAERREGAAALARATEAREADAAEVTGGSALAKYGSWERVPEYGSVWYPGSVPAAWAPYRYGHWGWVEPWGWTWIDDQPWGFAPFHYGRWVLVGRRWGWVPGVLVARPVYAPALVAFIAPPSRREPCIGWVPLGPREIFVPSYPASVTYIRQVNVTNIRNLTEVGIDRARRDDVPRLMNRRFATIVPQGDFVTARPVSDAVVATPALLAGARASMPPPHPHHAIVDHRDQRAFRLPRSEPMRDRPVAAARGRDQPSAGPWQSEREHPRAAPSARAPAIAGSTTPARTMSESGRDRMATRPAPLGHFPSAALVRPDAPEERTGAPRQTNRLQDAPAAVLDRARSEPALGTRPQPQRRSLDAEPRIHREAPVEQRSTDAPQRDDRGSMMRQDRTGEMRMPNAGPRPEPPRAAAIEPRRPAAQGQPSATGGLRPGAPHGHRQEQAAARPGQGTARDPDDPRRLDPR